jgi:hypothetical protein
MAPLATDLVRHVMELRPRFTAALRTAQLGESGFGVCGDVFRDGSEGFSSTNPIPSSPNPTPKTSTHQNIKTSNRRPSNHHPEEEGLPSAADDVADEFDDDFDAIKGMGRLFCEVSDIAGEEG